jgi:hypothetical protein
MLLIYHGYINIEVKGVGGTYVELRIILVVGYHMIVAQAEKCRYLLCRFVQM